MLEIAKRLNYNKLAALPYDEKKEMRKVLVYKADLCKDAEKVEMGRLGGLTNQENIRKIKSKIGELGSELKRLV